MIRSIGYARLFARSPPHTFRMLHAFFERLFFAPRWYHWPLIGGFVPLALLYGGVMWLRRAMAHPRGFGVPIVSVGNLLVGGTGKTPAVIALASRYPQAAVISRGYGRRSHGLVEVSRWGEVLADVSDSGDEAMLMARSLPQCSVIVSEDRAEGIRRAILEGAEVLFLDDGFSQVAIEKLEVLLEPSQILNPLPFPAGPLREFLGTRKYADLLMREGEMFERMVSFEDLTDRMVLVTAISQPQRLDPYLPKGVVGRHYLPDHAYFDEVMLRQLLKRHHATSLLVTQKDAVKMHGFKLPISRMKLELRIDPSVYEMIDHYLERFQHKS
jgi:tetraacyldisaccharide 4'-kinase